MDGDQLLGPRMQEPEQRDGRRLSSKNTKHRQQCLEQLSKHLDAHDIQKRVGKMSSVSQQRSFTAQEELEYNKINNCITEGMLAAEKNSSTLTRTRMDCQGEYVDSPCTILPSAPATQQRLTHT